MPLTYIDRLHPCQRREQQFALDADKLHKCDELELLEPEQMRPLALLSLRLLMISSLFFIALNLASYYWQQHVFPTDLTFWGVVLWLVINILGYIVILPIHELIHALAFVLLGGKPHFGTRLPLALYCGARNQVFRRNQYVLVGLAPFVVITLFSIIVTLLLPILASYTIFATIGNCAGAAGDVWVVARLLHLPSSVLVEDTEAGYRAWGTSVLERR